MPERKSHMKSRLGCVQCKARRVKCDETRPTCGNCNRRQESCSYKGARPTTSASPESLAGSDQAHTIPATLHLRQLELMHQWSTSTCFTLAVRTTGSARHQLEIPRLALIHDCLLDAVFAITSLHLAYLRPDDARLHIEDAMHYQARAVTATRQELKNLTAIQCEALFHASGFLGAITLAFRSVDPVVVDSTKPTETLLQLSRLWRGTTTILIASKTLVDLKTAYTFPPNLDMTDEQHSLPASRLQILLARLRHRAEVGDTGVSAQNGQSERTHEESRLIYLTALDKLQEIFDDGSYEYSRILSYIAMAPPPLFEYLHQGQPLACAILLLYTVLMQEFDTRWWTRDFRSQLIAELTPVVSAWDADMAEIVDYIQDWTKAFNESCYDTLDRGTGLADITSRLDGHTLHDPRPPEATDVPRT